MQLCHTCEVKFLVVDFSVKCLGTSRLIGTRPHIHIVEARCIPEVTDKMKTMLFDSVHKRTDREESVSDNNIGDLQQILLVTLDDC